MNIENIYIYIISRQPVSFFQGDIPAGLQYVTEDELTFTFEETREFFMQQEQDLPYEILRIIQQKSEGWPCAIYLTSLTVEKHRDSIHKPPVYSDTLIYETIDQEIFSEYSDEEQQFLIRLSLFDIYPLKMMETLFARELKCHQDIFSTNVFIRYNEHTRSFHVHQLFLDFLRSRTDQLPQEIITEMYLAGGSWFERQGLIVDALECYRSAQAHQAAWRVIETILPGYLTMEFAGMLLDIIRSFRPEFVKENPMVRVAQGALISAAGRLEAEPQLSLGLIADLEAECQTEKVKVALGNAYVNLGLCYMIMGIPEFGSCFKKACEFITEDTSFYADLPMFLLNGEPVTLQKGKKGEMVAWVHELEQAEPYYTRVLNGGMGGLAQLSRAFSCYYNGDIRQAEIYVFRSLYKGEENRQVDIVCQAYMLLLKIAIHKGEYGLAMEAMDKMEEYAKQHNTLTQFHVPDVARGWFFASLGLNQYIPDWIINERSYSMNSYTHSMGAERLVKAWSMLNEEDYYEMIPYLDRSEQLYQKLNKYINIIQVHMLKAIAGYYIGDLEMTVHELYISYEMSWRNDLVILFPAYGVHAVAVVEGLKKLSKNVNAGISEQAGKELDLLAAGWLDKAGTKASANEKRMRRFKEQYLAEHQPLKETEVFSPREKEILRAVGEGYTREEIADKLNLPSNIIKIEMKEIYARLGAINGTHAVRLATLRGLI